MFDTIIPNAWGLSDIHGNVSEWVKDRWNCSTGCAIDPEGPGSGTWKKVRPVAEAALLPEKADSYRNVYGRDSSSAWIGFRLLKQF